MTVNLSIDDLINKNYDTSKYKNVLDNGILTKEQIKILMIIKNIQENNILLSNKEKKQLENYFDKFTFNVKIEEKEAFEKQENDNLEEVLEINLEEESEINVEEDSDLANQLIEDPDLMTCPVKSKEGKTYRIKYISHENKIKMLALL